MSFTGMVAVSPAAMVPRAMPNHTPFVLSLLISSGVAALSKQMMSPSRTALLPDPFSYILLFGIIERNDYLVSTLPWVY